MSEMMERFLGSLQEESEGKWRTMERLLSAADAAKVFSPPVASGDHVVVTAAEVACGGGFGSGMGFGAPQRRRGRSDAEAQGSVGISGESGTAEGEGAGGGGGGGGASTGRPVAVIIIGPEGVRVKPIVDATKLGLAVWTVFGTVGALALRTQKQRKRL